MLFQATQFVVICHGSHRNLKYLCQAFKNSWSICPGLCVACGHAPSTFHLDCHPRVVSNNTGNICKGQSKQVGGVWGSLARRARPGPEVWNPSDSLEHSPIPTTALPSLIIRGNQGIRRKGKSSCFLLTGSSPEHDPGEGPALLAALRGLVALKGGGVPATHNSALAQLPAWHSD